MARSRDRGARGGASHPGGRGDRSPARQEKLRLWQAIVTPLVAVGVFFGLLEGLLALVGVEPTLRSEDPFVGFAANVPLFVEETDPEGREILTTSPNKLVFFNHQEFPRHKSPETYRIFCVGGSTTYGRPYDDATSFAGWLRELLPVADPQRRWEVINAGGISYASYRVAHLMEELAGYEPDLFVVYSGHNEFLEERTYGTLRDVPAAVRSTAGLLARTRIWAAMSRLLNRPAASSSDHDTEDGRYQLAGEVTTTLARSAGPERYERNDDLRDQILLHYRISLERTVDIARSAGADIIFVTPASNLRDSSPFKSQHSEGLTQADRSRSEALLATARAKIQSSAWSEALEALDEALAIDPRFAEIHYRRGKVLLALGRYEEAGAAFRRARDEDVCPLRALSPMQDALAEVARENDVTLVDFIDLVEQRVLKEEGHRIPGHESFLDHVHPTIATNRALAVALVETLTDKGVVEPAANWGSAAIAAVASQVEDGLDRDMHGWALTNLARVLFWAGKDEDAERLVRRALASGADDPGIEMAAGGILAKLYKRHGDLPQARVQFRRALTMSPGDPDLHMSLGLTFLERPGRDLERAAAHILLASVFWPKNDMTHQIFGLAMAERGRYAVAYPSLQEAVRLNPGNREAESALVRLQKILAPKDRRSASPKVTLQRYPSGAPRQVAQVRQDATGRFVRDGVLTDWYEDGAPMRFLDYADGVPHGTEVRWNPDGSVRSRAEYRHGSRTILPGQS